MYENYQKVLDYANDIVTRKKVACVEQIQACQRFLDDIASGVYDFDYKTPEKAIRIIETTFVHVKGLKKNQPFLLEVWELFIVYNLLGFVHKGTDKRRYQEAFIFIPRKNGKTPFSSALSWALSLIEYRVGSYLYIVAAVLRQALESFRIIKHNVERLKRYEDEEFRIQDNNNQHSIEKSFYDDKSNEEGSIFIQAIANDPANTDGLNANLIIADEIHQMKNSQQYMPFKQAMKAYYNKLLIAITTAGDDYNSFCNTRLDYCQRVLRKEIKDESYFIFICKADDPDDYTNPVEHEKANPNYRITIDPNEILAESLQAQNDPITRNTFLNKSLNIFTNSLSAYFDMFKVETSDNLYNWTIDDLLKMPIKWTGGADLSIMHDLTSSCLYGEYVDLQEFARYKDEIKEQYKNDIASYNEENGTDFVSFDEIKPKGVGITITHGFIPITTAKIKADEYNIPYFDWLDKGHLTMCNDNVVDYEQVVRWFIKMRAMGFKIENVGFDKYNCRDFVDSMGNHKFKMSNIDQSHWKKSEAFREVERKILSEKFYFLHSEAFKYCISNVKAAEDTQKQITFEKVMPDRKIDYFDATVIACKQWIINKEKGYRGKRLEDWFNK